MTPAKVLASMGPKEFSGPHPWGKKPLYHPTLLGEDVAKVQCWTFGVPAKKTCPGAVYGRNTVCSRCYACNGNYRYGSVKKAMLRRMVAMVTDEAQFIQAVNTQLATKKFRYVRLHDSGDFYAPEAIDLWATIAKQNPGIRFFSPTRTWRLDEFLPSLRRANRLKNFTIRPSALFIGEGAPKVRGLAGGLGVTNEQAQATCPASRKHGTCTESRCRRCWTQEGPIDFLLHN